MLIDSIALIPIGVATPLIPRMFADIFIDTYSLDEIEAKLSVICVRKKVSFELEASEEEKRAIEDAERTAKEKEREERMRKRELARIEKERQEAYELEQAKLEKERLALERERNALRNGNIGSDNDKHYGVVLIPEVIDNE